ncbi:MAG: sensor domain-containing diguanylate cyclase [Pseudomonadota bacterium]
MTGDEENPTLMDEVARLAALHRYQILDTPQEEAFDRIPRIIKSALRAPMAAVAFIDDERRWFKAVAGGKRGELPRSISFCNHTIQRATPTIVADTHLDQRFCANQLVVESPFIRSYLGVPLQTPDGYRIGSVCCVDKEPRDFTTEEIQLVKDLSAIVVDQLELRQLALFDPLTSVRSRRGFRGDAEMQLALSTRYGRNFSLLLLDIDHFKAINDTYGHNVGDEILSALGPRLSETLRDCDFVGRVGGEEFAVALPETDRFSALVCADRICGAVSAVPFETQAGPLSVSISLGAASYDGGDCGLDELFEAADKALYRAKADGRNCVRIGMRAAA